MAIKFGAYKSANQQKKSITFSEKQLFPVASAEVLLSTAQNQGLISDIKERVAMPEQHFRVLYQGLINDFAEFVQILPVANRGILGGILQEGLRRALFALEVPEKGKPRMHPLWTYVLFSAALLFDVARVVEDRMVVISDQRGAFLKKWQPLEGSMLDLGDYYKIRRGGGMQPWLCRRMTPLLAYKLMPEAGFKWIASKPQALNVWMYLLSDEAASAGGYGRKLNKALQLLSEFRLSLDYFINIPVEPTVPVETALGEEFAEWLKNGIEDGTIALNEADANVFMVDEGLFLEAPAIFEEFNKFGKTATDWRVVSQQFNELGFAPLSGDDYKFQQYFSNYPETKSGAAAKTSVRGTGRASFLGGDKAQQATSQQQQTRANVDTKKAGAMFGATTSAASVTQQQAETRGTFQTSTHIKNGTVVPTAMVQALLGNQATSVDGNMRASDPPTENPYPDLNATSAAATASYYAGK